MLATEILIQDHRLAMSLIEQLEGATDGTGSYAGIFNQLVQALALHMREEEEIYYPALARHEEFAEQMDDQVAEHEMVKQMLLQMNELVPSSDEFQDLLSQLKTAIEAHVTKEEDDIFPESIEVLGSDSIEQLGDEIKELKNDGEMSQAVNM
ncbi:MAG TPA: hemerythrin domain-containing protein [Pyrinomonadaceae bacterium]|jgi:iron-sulfur cluster repair protein YtfE (RIC family)